MTIKRRELFWYVKNRGGVTWLSYIILTGFFMLGIDFIKGSTQSFIFYFSVIIPFSFAMAIVELFFFRKVVRANNEDLQKILAITEALGYKMESYPKDRDRQIYSMSGRKFFLRTADIVLLKEPYHIYLNVNIFHMRYFRQFVS